MTQCAPWRVVTPLLSPADPILVVLLTWFLSRTPDQPAGSGVSKGLVQAGLRHVYCIRPPYLDKFNSSKLDVHNQSPKTSAINSQIKGYTQIKEYIQENANSWFAWQTSQYV